MYHEHGINPWDYRVVSDIGILAAIMIGGGEFIFSTFMSVGAAVISTSTSNHLRHKISQSSHADDGNTMANIVTPLIERLREMLIKPSSQLMQINVLP